MKKLILFILASLLLTGCQETKKEIEAEAEPYADTRTVYESNTRPRYITILYNNEVASDAQLLSYCWNENLNECSSTLNQSPKEKLANVRKEKVSPAATINFYVDANPTETLPFPTTTEIFLVEEEELTPVTITNDSLTVPNEEGIYTYVIKTVYDDEFKGIAFYTFHLRVVNK